MNKSKKITKANEWNGYLLMNHDGDWIGLSKTRKALQRGRGWIKWQDLKKEGWKIIKVLILKK